MARGLAFALAGFVACLGGTAQAQLCAPTSETGQFSVPFGPFSSMDDLQEIAHAIVLPPPDSDPDIVRVLFICRSNCVHDNPLDPDVECAPTTYETTGARAYVWRPLQRLPGTAQLLQMPQPDGVGRSDSFCSGHTVDADGNAVIAGGVNYFEKCTNPATCIQDTDGDCNDTNTQVGHKRVFVLDTTYDTLSLASWSTALLARERWYPELTVLNDGTIGVFGHFGAPSASCPIPAWPYGSDPDIPYFREVFDTGTMSSTAILNRLFNAASTCTTSDPTASIGDYPRMHLLSTGQLLDVDAANTAQGMVSTMMDILHPPCSTSDLRWEKTTGTYQTSFTVGGSSVHYFVRDTTASNAMRDVVYYVGGIAEGDDTPCLYKTTITAKTWRFKDADVPPAGGSDDALNGDWEEMAPMAHARVNQNAVLLPTGSFMVFGGAGVDAGGNCIGVHEAEEFFPTEIFGGADTGEWEERASHTDDHNYHSVAFLLPDGRVGVAGGQAQDGSNYGYHEVEVFSPWYYFMGVRPAITDNPDPSTEPITYGGDFLMSVALDCNSTNFVDRVVLIRSCAPTHAFDMSQRYVELESSVQSGSYPNFVLQVQAPSNGFAAPPGFYLLFVVDKYGVPSEGRWVKVQ